MKHIYIIDEYISSKQNGVGTYVRHFAQMFDATDTQVNIISFNAEVKELCISADNGIYRYDIPFCAQGDFLNTGELEFSLLSLYIEDKYNNIFFVNHSPCVDLLRAIRSNFPKSKMVFTIHDQGWTTPLLGNSKCLEELKRNRLVKIEGLNHRVASFVVKYCNEEKKMYNIADAIICLSRSTYQLLHDFYGIDYHKLYFIPNCLPKEAINIPFIEKDEARKILHLNDSEKVLLYVGRTSKAKGIIELLRVFERIYYKIKNVRLVIVGEVHSLEEFTKLTPTSCSQITYTGLISSERLALWYASADIGIIPSYTEQCSYAALEMMHTPGVVVTTDGWGLDEVFNDKNAIIAPIQRKSNEIETKQFEESLYSALIKALSLEEADLEALKLQCRTLLENRYNFDNVSLKYKKLLNDITSAI